MFLCQIKNVMQKIVIKLIKCQEYVCNAYLGLIYPKIEDVFWLEIINFAQMEAILQMLAAK